MLAPETLKKQSTLTAEGAMELLDYNPATGIFTWKKGLSPRVKAGDVAGTQSIRGYKVIMIDKVAYKSHRLAWLVTYGVWPQAHIDHINGVCGDDRIENLREATNFQNQANRRMNKGNRSGYKGVRFDKGNNNWQAKIQHQGRLISLGRHKTPEAAHAAYCKAAHELHGEFARTK
jgi:hypothetical protein